MIQTKGFFFGILSLLISCGGLPTLERSVLDTVSTVRFVQTSTSEYTVASKVSGLIGKGLEIQNGSEVLTISQDGSYTFASKFLARSNYDVKVKTQPSEPAQICEVSGGSGSIVRGNIESIQVTCGEDPNRKIALSGTVTGLSGSGLQLQLIAGTFSETISVSGTSFAFSSLAPGSTYSVSVASQPSNPSQTCSFSSTTTGTISAPVAFSLSCSTNRFTVEAQVVGISTTLGAGQELQLMLNGSETILVSTNGTFPFTASILSGESYTLAVLNANGYISSGKCSIPSNTGIIGASKATVLVNCSDGFTVQGTVSIPGGTASSVIGSGLQLSLQNTGGTFFATQTLAVSSGSTSFIFGTPIPNGSSYQISVSQIPSPNQSCSVSLSTGTISGADITNPILDCGLPEILVSSPISGSIVDNDINSITFSNLVSGADYRYTKGNGSQVDPTCSTGTQGSVTPPSVSSNSNSNIKFIQCRSGWSDSPVSSVNYTLKAGDPSLGKTSGTSYSASETFSITTTTTGSPWQCVTTDSTAPPDPSCGMAGSTCVTGTPVSGTFTFGSSGQIVNLKARTCKVGYSESNIVTATYNPSSFNVGGTISGLTTPFGANTFVLRNNGSDDLTIAANGSFTFSTPLSTGATYNISIASQPQNPWQTCNLTNASGTVSGANVTNVGLSCTLNSYSISGSVTSSTAMVSGLSISNGSETVNVTPGSTSTPITFATALNSGQSYSLSVTAEPVGQVCQVDSDFTGTVAGANVTNVSINCISGYRNASGIIERPVLPINISFYRGRSITQAGSGTLGFVNASGGSARFNFASGMIYDGKDEYLADTSNHAIRKFTPSGQLVSTIVGNGTPGLADGTGAISALNEPFGIVTDGTFLYISETLGNRIRRLKISNGVLDTIAGDNSTTSPANGSTDATGLSARFSGPKGLALDGENLYIADSGNNAIRVLNLRTRVVTTLTNNASFLDSPEGLVVIGNTIYSTNTGNSRDCITATNKSTGINSTFAGTPGTAGYQDGIGVGQARFNNPRGITHDTNNLYIADSGNNRLRRIEIATGQVTTILGSGSAGLNENPGIEANFTSPLAIINLGDGLAFTHQHAISLVQNLNSVAYYPLNGNLTSYHGNNSLTPSGTPTYGLGRFGEANGAAITSNTMGFTANRSFSGTNNLTMSGWFFWDGTDAASSKMLIYNGNPCSSGSGLLLASDGRIEVLRGGTGGASTNQRFPANVWVHLALTINSLNSHSVYYNGNLVFQGTATPAAAENNFSLGSNGCGFIGFPGRIAEVRLYNRVLSDGEIQELAKDASSGLVGTSYSKRPRDLLLHYSFKGVATSSGPIGSTVTTAGGYQEGPDGTASGSVTFNGTTNNIITPGNGLPSGGSARSICSWVFPYDYPGTNNRRTILYYGNSGTTGLYFTFNLWNDAGSQKIEFGAGGSGQVTFTYSLPLNRWSYLCGTYDGSQSTIYVDGHSLGSAVSVSGINTSNNNSLVIGSWNGSQYFAGKLSEIRVYGRGLTQSEVRTLSAQIPIGLVARYDFAGDTQDVSGFGITGSITGTVTPTSDRFGTTSAYSFPGTHGNFISGSLEFIPIGVSPRSMCMWYRATSGDFAVPFAYGNPAVSNAMSSIWLQTQNLVRYWGQNADINANLTVNNFIWRHICVTNTGASNTSSVYVNGKLVASGAHILNIPDFGSLTMGSAILTREYGGQLDEMLVYNRELSSSEVRAMSGYHPMQVSTWNSIGSSSSLKLHMQADSLSNLADGAIVNSWVDQSGNARTFTQGTGAPRFDSIAFQESGIKRHGINFVAASNQFLEYTVGGSLDLPTNNSSFFSVFQRPTNGSIDGLFEVNSAGGMSYYLNQFRLEKSTFAGSVIGFSGNSFGTLNKAYIGSVSFSQNSFINFFNNGGASVGTTVNASLALGSNSFAMIGRTNVNSSAFNGSIGEILYFNQVLNAANSKIVHCYLSQKYNIPLDSAATFTCD